jgi:molybdate transport system substrate-binding protein
MALTALRLQGITLRFQQLFLLTALLTTPDFALAEEIRVAAASNFRDALTELGHQFEASTGNRVLLIFGSTGKHYAQITHGAPFDAFFAADSERPALLEKDGLAIAGSRFTYARGQLVLFRPGRHDTPLDRAFLESRDFRYLAIANPELAPYGRAAQDVLEALGLWESLQQQLVRGENIGQAYQFVVSGNADAGFIARSQLAPRMELPDSNYWLVPARLHQPIDQQAVLLRDHPAARDFMLYVQSDAAITVILNHGYLQP